jgi:Fe-S cluster biogenesis protein NfuA
VTARDTPPDLDAAHAESAAELARRADELARLETLAQGWEPTQQGILSAIKTGIEELNAAAFTRLIRALKGDEAAAAALRKAVRDPLVYQVLLFHGIVKEPLEHRVARALEEARPSLKSHGGDVELVAVKFPDTVEVRLIGSCQSCPSSGETLSEGVEKAIKALCPEITTVSGNFTATSSTSPPCDFSDGRTSSSARATRCSSGSLTMPWNSSTW